MQDRYNRGAEYGAYSVSTLLMAEVGDASAPTVTIHAGVHGDERAAPWALLSIVRDGLLDARFAYRLWPCLNPTGYAAGTRENAEGDDINRSFSRGGTTQVVPQSDVSVDEEKGKQFVTVKSGASLASLVSGLNALGVTPRDMISILQTIKAAGGLQADIEVM